MQFQYFIIIYRKVRENQFFCLVTCVPHFKVQGSSVSCYTGEILSSWHLKCNLCHHTLVWSWYFSVSVFQKNLKTAHFWGNCTRWERPKKEFVQWKIRHYTCFNIKKYAKSGMLLSYLLLSYLESEGRSKK